MEPEDKPKMDMKAVAAQNRSQELAARLETQRQQIEAEGRIIKPIMEQATQWLREAEIPRDAKMLLTGAALGAFGFYLAKGRSSTRKRRRSDS